MLRPTIAVLAAVATAACASRQMEVESGGEVIPAGSVVYGKVSALDDSDHPADQALIQLAFSTIRVNGRDYPFTANVTNVAEVKQTTKNSETVAKSAATGAAIGAAAGTVISLGVGDVEHVIPIGTRMTIQSTQQVTLR